MAMFSNNPREGSSVQGAETFIGPSVKMEGNFSGDGDIVIEGVLVGTVITKGDVKVGQNAVIEAEIRAKNAYVAGKVKGNLSVANLLKLSGSAIVVGDVKTQSIGIEEGAILNGKINMAREKAVRETARETVPEKTHVEHTLETKE